MQKQYTTDQGITSSMMLTWLGCRQAARYYCDGWVPAVGPEAAAFGSCWHALLRWVYSKVEYRPSMSKESVVEEGLAAAKEFYPIWRREQSRLCGSVRAMEDLENHVSMCEGLLPGYLHQWPKDFQRKIQYDLETEFDLDFHGFRLRGKRDAVFVDSKKKLHLLETKTKSRIDEADNLEVLSFDFQSLFYVVATSIEMKRPISSIVYNVVRRPQIRQKINETPAGFAARLAEDVLSRPEFYFIRYDIIHPQNEVAAFEADLLIRLQEFQRWVDGKSPTYRSECTCQGRWTCRYLHACASRTMDGYMQRELFSELEEA